MAEKKLGFTKDPFEYELVRGSIANDRKMQKALYDRYKDAMYTILYRLLDNEDEAADALQEAFVEVFRSLKNFKHLSTLGAWVKTIVVRKGLAKQKKLIPMEQIDESQQDIQPITWDSNLTGEYLEKAIRQLPSGYKNVFLMIEVEGYSHRETAGILGISEGTSKSQLYYAKQNLQKLLKEIMT